MNADDPAVRTWRQWLAVYREHHDHDPCRLCDPQLIAEDHLLACYEYEDYLNEGDPDSDEAVDPAYGPFCGCTTCVVREVLHSALPALLHHFTRGHDDEPDDSLRVALQREWDHS